MEHLGLHLIWAVPGRPDLVAVSHHHLLHYLRGLVRDNSHGELSYHLHTPESADSVRLNPHNYLSRDDSLGPGVSEGPLDTVKGERGISPPRHQSLDLVLPVHQSPGGSDISSVLIHVKVW